MTYAALLGAKSEAAVAIKHLLAQINNDHANSLIEIVFRSHSDKGGDFMKEALTSIVSNMAFTRHRRLDMTLIPIQLNPLLGYCSEEADTCSAERDYQLTAGEVAL